MTRKLFSFLIMTVLVLTASICFSQEEAAQTPAAAVEVTEIEPFFYAAVAMKGSYDQHGDAFQTLMTHTNLQEAPVDMQMFGIYYSDPSQVPVDSLMWEVGMKMTEAKELTSPLTCKKWDASLMASIHYKGSFNETDAVYGVLYGWIMQNGYTPVGPVMEKFLSIPEQDNTGAWSGEVEICTPVQKAQ